MKNINLKELRKIFMNYKIEMLLITIITMNLLLFDVWILRESNIDFIILLIGLFFVTLGVTKRGDKRITTKKILFLVIYLVFGYFAVYKNFTYRDIYYPKVMIYFLYLLSSFMLMLITPFIYIKSNEDRKSNFYSYIVKMIDIFSITILYSIILFVGANLVIFALESLFSLNLYSTIALKINIIIATFIIPSIFLSYYPDNLDELKEQNGKLKKTAVLYFLVPIIVIYEIIIYLYFLKIILTRSFPLNIVTYLVSVYIIIGFITVIVIRGVAEIKKPLANLIEIVYYISSIPLVILFAFSLYRRINNYGITPDRYLLLMFLFWVTVSIIMYFLKRSKFEMLFFAAILIIISYSGPLNLYDVSFTSQKNRLVNLLKKNEINRDGITSKKVSKEDKKEISEKLSFLTNRVDRGEEIIKIVNVNKELYIDDSVFYSNLKLNELNDYNTHTLRDISVRKNVYIKSELEEVELLIPDYNTINSIKDYGILDSDELRESLLKNKVKLIVDNVETNINDLIKNISDRDVRSLEIIQTTEDRIIRYKVREIYFYSDASQVEDNPSINVETVYILKRKKWK